MSDLLFVTLYVSCLILPGLAAHQLIRLKLDYYLTSLSISYSLFTLAFISSNHYSVEASTFFNGYIILIVSSIFYLCYHRIVKRTKIDLSYFLPITVIVVVSGLYQILVGSFTEVPADLYAHLERYQTALATLNDNSLGKALNWKNLLLQDSGVFYYLVAGISSLTKIPSQDLLTLIDFTNRTLYLVAVFCFARIIFRYSSQPILIATLCVVFVTMHMGINVFAYVRYYTLAPTMLNLILYMTAITVFIKAVNGGTFAESAINYTLILAFSICAAAIHTQEAMFIGVMIASMSLIASLNLAQIQIFRSQLLDLKIDSKQVITIATLAVCAFISLYIYSRLNLVRAPNAHWRLWEFAPSYGFLPSITTLNLKLQFSKVITLWGLLVYVLFFLNIKRYRNNLFVIAGMLSPIVTILNPFFIDIFLRHYNSTTVWRLCYLIPIHFVAGDLFVHYIKTARESSILKKGFPALVTIALIGLLLPIKNTWNGVHYSRFPTLSSSKKNISPVHFKDLLQFLESLDSSETILTDPMTGYMVSALTHHNNYRHKFFRGRYFQRFTFENYDTMPLKKYRHQLLIINKRNKGLSDVGSLSKHWNSDEWQRTTAYYPDHLISHLNSNKKHFKILWNAGDIQVYRVLN